MILCLGYTKQCVDKMKQFLARLNALCLIVLTILGIYAVFYQLGDWYPDCEAFMPWNLPTPMPACVFQAHNHFLFYDSGKIWWFAIISGTFLPLGYCVASAIVSWLFGAGFKMHLKLN